MCLKFEIWGQIDWKSCFWKIWVEFKCFWKNFNLILMHFIHEILCFEEFLHKIAPFFKKKKFSKFSIDRICCSTYRKCDKNFGLNLPGSIGTRLIEFNFWSIEANFRPIENRSMGVLKRVFSRVLHTIQTFSNTPLTIFLDRSNLKQFLSFSSLNLSRVFVFKH